MWQPRSIEHPPADGACHDRQFRRPAEAGDVCERDHLRHRRQAPTAAIPLSAIIYEGDTARAWVAVEGEALEVRQLKARPLERGRSSSAGGLGAGDKVVTRGTLFVDRAAGS